MTSSLRFSLFALLSWTVFLASLAAGVIVAAILALLDILGPDGSLAAVLALSLLSTVAERALVKSFSIYSLTTDLILTN